MLIYYLVFVSAKNILEQCDAVRDVVLPQLGVRLEDHEGLHHFTEIALIIL